MLNLTLLSLVTTNFQHSPLFVSHSNVIASRLCIQNSFSTIFKNYQNSLKISNSVFRYFLSSPVIINNLNVNGIQYSSYIISSETNYNFRNSYFQYVSNGPAIYILDCGSTYTFSQCSFSFIKCPESKSDNKGVGGAIFYYATEEAISSESAVIDIQNTYLTHCFARVGSSFYMDRYKSLKIAEVVIESSAPYRLPGVSNNMFLSRGSEKTDISAVNDTNSCSLKESSAIALKCKGNINVIYFTSVGCNGENTMSIESVSSSGSSTFYPNVARFSNLIFISNIGNLKGVIKAKGSFIIEDSVFIFNKHAPVYVEYGHVVLSKCWLDTPYYLSGSVSFSDCVYEIHRPQDVIRYTKITQIVRFSDVPLFPGERSDVVQLPPKTHGFSMNLVGKLSIAGIVLTIILIIVVIFAFIKLRSYRKHIIHTLHETYADEAESKRRDRENNLNNNNAQNIEQNEKKSDESSESEKNKNIKIEYKFDVEVPDTYMWDTDDGDADIMNQQDEGIFKQGIYEQYQEMNKINKMKKMSKMKKIKKQEKQDKKKPTKAVNEETPLLDNKDKKADKKKNDKKKVDKKKADKKKADKKKNEKKSKSKK